VGAFLGACNDTARLMFGAARRRRDVGFGSASYSAPELVKGPRQPRKRLVNQFAHRSQRMIRRNASLQTNATEKTSDR
jgi:hypothetical protein